MKFNHDLSVPKVPFREARRERADLTRNAALPFALALGSGFVTFIAIGLIALGFRWPVKWPLVLAGMVMLLVMAWWLWLLWHQRLLWTIETVTGKDWDADGQIGEPKSISIELASPDQRSMKWLHLPVEEEDLRRLCIGLVIQQRPFSEAEWTGRGRPFSRAQFRTIRAKMLEAGVICWKDERHKTQGTEFTAYGKQALRKLLEQQGYVRTTTHAGGTGSRRALPSGEWGDDDPL